MAKTADALQTMGEVESRLDTRDHLIRYWEKKFPQIKPVKINGRRYFRPADVHLLAGIKFLVDTEHKTLKYVKTLLSDKGVNHLRDLGQTALSATVEKAETVEKETIVSSVPAEQEIRAFGITIRFDPDRARHMPAEHRAELGGLYGRLEAVHARIAAEVR